MSSDISLKTDIYGVPEDVHQEYKTLLTDLGFSVEDQRSDTHAIGGPFWHPSDFILSIGSHLFDAVLGAIVAKGIDKMITLYKKIHFSREGEYYQLPHFYINTGLSLPIGVYFEFESYDYRKNEIVKDQNVIRYVFSQIPDTVKKLNSCLSKELLELLGSPHSIVMKYDYEKQSWLIREYNSQASIFYDYLFSRKNK